MKLDAICKIVAAGNNRQMFKLKQGFLKLIVTDSDNEDEQTQQEKDIFWASLRDIQKSIISVVHRIKEGADVMK